MPRTDDLRPFTAMQYYLAHAQNRVHLILGLSGTVSPEAFRDLVAQVVEAAPQLRMQETLVLNGHRPDPVSTLDDLIEHRCVLDATAGRAALMDRLAHPMHDTGKAAFRALCRSAASPDAEGVRSWIAFQTTHALMEGGDIASILRGRVSVHDDRPVVDSDLSPLMRVAAALLPAFFWGLHMLAAASERRDPDSFVFLHQTLNRQDLAATARRLGVSQRAVVFGLVAHALLADPARRRPASLIYSTLPTERARLCDDEFLNLRMDELRVPLGMDPLADIRATATAIESRGPSPIFVQTWQRRLNQWHQALHSRAPWLYPRRFFGFAPYELVLSMLPPVDTARFSPILAGSQLYAGSNTGSVPTCIMVPTRDHVSLTLWASPAMQARFDRLSKTAQDLGIGCGPGLAATRLDSADAGLLARGA